MERYLQKFCIEDAGFLVVNRRTGGHGLNKGSPESPPEISGSRSIGSRYGRMGHTFHIPRRFVQGE